MWKEVLVMGLMRTDTAGLAWEPLDNLAQPNLPEGRLTLRKPFSSSTAELCVEPALAF